MVDHNEADLPYGHFGHAVYNHETKEWIFQRSSNQNHVLRPVSESTVAIPASAALAARPPESKYGPARRHENQVKALIKSNSELQPATSLLPELARISEAVEDATDRHDPAKDKVLVFGTVVDQFSKLPRQFAVCPAGPTGGDLRVVLIQRHSRNLSNSWESWLRLPSPDGKEVTWNGPGAPIQSVNVSQSPKPDNTLIAVRLITKSLIFRLTLNVDPIANVRSLELDSVLSIDIEDTGGRPHADVAINPWHGRQFAVVDQAGSWFVYEFAEGLRSESTRLICHASIGSESRRKKKKPVDDGWARITWTHNANTILVCSRQTLKLFKIAEKVSLDLNSEYSELQDVDVGIEKGIGWILDMETLDFEPSYICVLTSSHVYVLRIEPDSEDDLLARNVLAFRHFRNAEDISLRLRLFQDDGDVGIVIRSGISPVISVHRISMDTNGHTCVSDPTELVLNNKVQDTVQSGILDLHIHPISTESSVGDDGADSTTRQLNRSQPKFYSVAILCKNLSLVKTIYVASRADVPIQPKPGSLETLPSGDGRRPQNQSISERNRPDPNERLARNEPLSEFVTSRKAQARAQDRSGSEWTVNYELSVQSLVSTDLAEVTEMDAILRDAQDRLNGIETDLSSPMQTLRELVEGELNVQDLEEAAEGIHNLRNMKASEQDIDRLLGAVEEPEHSSQQVLRPIDLPPNLGIDLRSTEGRLDDLLQSIVDDWISPLSEDVPDATRRIRQQLAHRTAAEVALASHVFRQNESQIEQQDQRQSQTQTFNLPVRPTPSRTTPSEYFDADSQVQPSTLPTPSTSRSPSTVTGSSHPSTFAALEFARLSRYTTFSKPAPPALPRPLQRVLSHWTPGSDPADYDWQASSHHVSQREEDFEGEELTEREQKRLQRRAERYMRRQRREAEESQRQQMLSRQVPTLVTASQPSQAESQPTGTVGSSQPAGFSQTAASQVLPGRHGGRPPARKKHKRKSGF